jgi:hypothetical protein
VIYGSWFGVSFQEEVEVAKLTVFWSIFEQLLRNLNQRIYSKRESLNEAHLEGDEQKFSARRRVLNNET